MKMKAKGIGLMSGGLDSTLAVKVLQEQEIGIICVTFKTPFFGPEPALEAARLAGCEIRVLDISRVHLEMLKRPVFGYGSQMNPCIDCHALMLREAGRLMEEEGADFLFTGEVVGQRPMSQRRDSMRSVEKLSGYSGRILRPLSARLLPPTVAEQEGLVDRDRLLDINGRSRKRQMALAQHYGITDYPQAGGGCMLTKEGFSNKLRELFKLFPDAGPREARILKHGRHLRVGDEGLCAIGRNRGDNERLTSLSSPDDVIMRVLDVPSPTAVLVTPKDPERDIRLAASLLVAYSDAPEESPARVSWKFRESAGVMEQVKSGREFLRGAII